VAKATSGVSVFKTVFKALSGTGWFLNASSTDDAL
jgi:hypothetical protein